MLCRVDIRKRVAATSPVKVSEVRYQTSDEESHFVSKRNKTKKILDKGYDAAMNVISEARAKSLKTRDEATNKAADFIAKPKRNAESVVSLDETDIVYFSDEELSEQMKQKADSL